MNKLSIIISIFICLFVLEGVAEAASVSTRVRILESKSYKHSKQIKQQVRDQKKLVVRVDKGLQEIEDVKLQVERFISKAETKKKKQGRMSPGYSYP